MRALLIAVLVLGSSIAGVEATEPAQRHLGDSEHSHPAPEKLGTVSFGTSCKETAQFDHALALLHSFAYEAAGKEFAAFIARDPNCAIAHWGAAMSVFHQLWSPPGVRELEVGRDHVTEAQRIGTGNYRERGLIDAAAVYFSDAEPAHHAARAKEYERAMQSLAERLPRDDEVQIWYALALVGTAPPTDRRHINQKRAAAILEPIYLRQPDHPGVAHYLIHACDSTELAPRGLKAARDYAKIAPAAPHALHMPSHIFTRLGLWDDSIASNEAARRAARTQGDIGEELHAMDYLTYAYLQRGREADARRVVADLRAMGSPLAQDFKVGYAATAMPVRLVMESGQWNDALALEPLPGSAPHVAALAYWARAVAHARSGHADLARAEAGRIDGCEAESRARGDAYWAAQIGVLSKEARAWGAQAAGNSDEALATLRDAANAEDELEKLPVTPGPIVPAREQLGQLLLELHRPKEALAELTQALKDAPGRRAGLEAAIHAADAAGDSASAARFRRLLPT